MDNDTQLDTLLSSYTVEQPDSALLERIVARAKEDKAQPKRVEQGWFKTAPLIAACALFGFMAGGLLPQETTSNAVQAQASTQQTTDSVNYDAVILGATTLQEVQL